MKYTEIILHQRIKNEVLALGAQSKSAFCFAKGNFAYLSDAGGDLSELENFNRFEKEIKKAQKRLKIKPGIIACDLHPEYISTKYAKDKVVSGIFGIKPEGLSLKTVQHHEAHVASCIADNDIKGKVIGAAFDGTGFGSDGSMWGGEFFTGDIRGLKRVAHLKYIPMPGGEACIKEPWRMAFSYLYDIYGKKGLFYPLRGQWRARNDILKQMVDKKINSPLTSSMGRLFDGVSALIGVCDFSGYEGEAAINLEKTMFAQGYGFLPQKMGRYKFKYISEGGMTIIDWEPVIKGIVKDLKLGIKNHEISLKFHEAVCYMIKDVCGILRKEYKIKKVCMSGGVFQNKYLTGRVKPMLEKEGHTVYMHKNVPAHDGGIALGQAILAYQRLHSDIVRV